MGDVWEYTSAIVKSWQEPVAAFYASNGDLLKFTNYGFNYNESAKYLVWRRDTSTTNDGGWVGCAVTGYPSGSSPAFTAYMACASSTTSDTFYVIGKFKNSTTTERWVGLKLVYDTGAKTLTYTGGTTDIGLIDSDVFRGSENEFVKRPRVMYHDGTSIHLLATRCRRWDDREGTNYDFYTDLIGWEAAGFGTAAYKAKLSLGSWHMYDGWPCPPDANAISVTQNSGRILVMSGVPQANPYSYGYRAEWINGVYVVTGPFYTFNTATIQWFEVSLGASSYTQHASGTLGMTTYNGFRGGGDMITMSDNSVVIVHGTNQLKRGVFTTSMGTFSDLPGASASYTIPTQPASYGNPVAQSRGCLWALALKTSSGPYREVYVITETDGIKVWVNIPGRDLKAAVTVTPPSTTRTGGPLRTANGTIGGAWATTSFIFWSCNLVWDSSTGTGSVTESWLNLESNDYPVATPRTPVDGVESFDQTSDTIVLDWDYADGSDSTQTSYEVKLVEKIAGASSYYLAGGALSPAQQTVTSAETQAQISPGTLWTTSYGYQWTVRVQDTDLAWSGWTPWNTFFVSGRPVATILSPEDGKSHYGNRPVVRWRYSDPEANPQYEYRITLYDDDMNILWESGPVYTGGEVSNLTETSGEVGYTCDAGKWYRVGVKVMDSSGVWSAESMARFECFYAPTAYTTFDTTVNGSTSVTIDFEVTGAKRVELYRYSNRLEKYILLAEYNGNSFTYDDVSAPLNGTYKYKVTAYRDGFADSWLSSDISPTFTDWDIRTAAIGFTCGVSEMAFDHPRPQNMYEPLGRSKQIVITNSITRGSSGRLAIRIDASVRDEVLAKIHSMISSGLTVYIKSPYDATYAVLLSPPRQTWGIGGLVDISMEFTEVADA